MAITIRQPLLPITFLLVYSVLTACGGSESSGLPLQSDTGQQTNYDVEGLAQQPTGAADYFCGGDTYEFRANGEMTFPPDSTYTVVGGLVTISTPTTERIAMIKDTDLIGSTIGCYFLSGEVLPINNLPHNDPVFRCDGETYRFIPSGDLAADDDSYPALIGSWVRRSPSQISFQTEKTGGFFDVIDGELANCEHVSGPTLSAT